MVRCQVKESSTVFVQFPFGARENGFFLNTAFSFSGNLIILISGNIALAWSQPLSPVVLLNVST